MEDTMQRTAERTTQQVFDDHEVAFKSGDMDLMMADYADDAVMLLLDRFAIGKEAIQATFEGLFNGFPGLKISFEKTAVQEDLCLLQFSGDSDVATIPHGAATFVIQNGKIQRQTECFVVVPK